MITDCAAVDVLMCRSTNVYTIAASEGNAWMYEKTAKRRYTDHFTYDPDIYSEEVATKMEEFSATFQFLVERGR
jgi:hypothetical protein